QIARTYYDRFDPSGRFQVEMTAARDAFGQPMHLDGRLRLDDAAGTYHKFPYPAHDVSGVVRFTGEEIVIESLTGRGPGDTTFTFESGRIAPPGDGAQVQMTIHARNVP